MRWDGAAVVAIALIGGCERTRTEIIVMVDSEIAWGLGRTVQSVVLTVRRGGATGPFRSARTTALGQGRAQLPMLVGVIESLDDTDTPVWIEALGCGDPNGCTAETAVVAQRAVVRFVEGQTLELPLLLASACMRVACASDQRCATDSGQCEAATRAQETVRPFTGSVEPVGDDASVVDVPADAATMMELPAGDAGTVDIGADEAAADDAGLMDVGSPDIGVNEVGITDRGTIDSGSTDLGPGDGGLTDRGVVDTGPVDAGPTGSTIECRTQVSSRTCRGDGGFAPCCIVVTPILPPVCGTAVPILGCVPN